MTVYVVAAAIVRDGRVLAARRRPPHRFAGGWEFPGGKVEEGEDGPDALVRECREELGVGVTVGALLGTASDEAITIELYACTLADGDPRPLEDHDELRWLARDERDALPWLPIDADLLRHLPL